MADLNWDKRSAQWAEKSLEACTTGAPNVCYHCPSGLVHINSVRFCDAVAHATGRLAAEWQS